MQKKNTLKHKVTSTKVSATKADSLAPFKAQAAPIIELLFDGKAPEFVSDLLHDWLTELENRTQIFWNTRAVCEIALPLMLREADQMGLELESAGSSFIEDIAATWSQRLTFNRENREERAEPEKPITPVPTPEAESENQPEQFTPVRMLPVWDERAIWLAENLVLTGDEAEPLAELIAGIAAIECNMTRQELAYQAIRACFHMTNEHQKPIADFLTDIYEKRSRELAQERKAPQS